MQRAIEGTFRANVLRFRTDDGNVSDKCMRKYVI